MRARTPSEVRVDRKKLADDMIAELRKTGNVSFVWGDAIVVTVGRRCGYTGHPIDVMQKTINALRISDRFEKSAFHGMDSLGRSRITTYFKATELAAK